MGLGLDAYNFNPERKLRFITLAEQLWPDISQCCKGIGIHPVTFYNHMKRDEKFREAINAIKASKLDELERVAIENGRDKSKGFLDRAMILRAHRPELYDRAKVVRVEGYSMKDSEKTKRLESLSNAIDTSIVSSYTTRKERQRLKRGGVSDAKAKPQVSE